MYQKFLAVLSLLALFAWCSPAWAAGGGADYGRGPETDPVALAAGAIGDTQVGYNINAAKLTTNSTPPRLNLVNGTNLPISVTKQTGAVTATAVVTPQTPSAVTPTITVTAQRPGAQTPTITVTPQAPATVTPTITVTKETGAVTASGANNLVTPTATITPQAPGAVTPTITVTPQTPGVQTPTITVTLYATTIYDSTGAACTNATGEIAAVVTGVTATCSALPDFATNSTASSSTLPVFMTNATCAISPDLASNSVVAVSVIGGGAVMTNSTAVCSTLPDFATNATAVSSALLDYPTNATATCSTLPDFATNATAAITVIGGGLVMTNAIATNP